MILKLFLVCTFKDANFVEKLTNLAEKKNKKKKMNSVEFMEFVFSKSDLVPLFLLCQLSFLL